MSEENMVSEGALINAINQIEFLNSELNVLKNKMEIEVEKSKVSKQLIDNLSTENIELRAQLNFINNKIMASQQAANPEKKTEQQDEPTSEEIDSSKSNVCQDVILDEELMEIARARSLTDSDPHE